VREAFAREDVDKGYLAVVHGRVERALDVVTAIAHDPRDPRRMIIDVGGRGARTSIRPLVCHDDVTLVDVTAHGGRRHQVRVHLASIGHPLVGDVLYGAPPCDLEHHALHAHRLALPGVPVVYAPVPTWLRELATPHRLTSGLPVPVAVRPA
jgi:23S rRNA-/tRNA-specific pseudouridylate synthase